VSAQDERIDALLDRIEAAFAPVPDLLAWSRSATENSAAALAASVSNGNEIGSLRTEAKTLEGRFSALEAKVDVMAADVAEIKDGVAKANKTIEAFRAELRSGFSELWKHLMPDEPSETPGNVATVHPIRQHEPAE
jgi:outer membrane murein-binding lipoprotein Lpp